jgi:hypothetical protein
VVDRGFAAIFGFPVAPEEPMSYDRVTIFLRAPLFALTGDAAHVPANAYIVEGAIVDDKGGPVVTTKLFRDEKGRVLAEKVVNLIIPWGKIDHVRIDS